ncbi:MAG: hypothetical protein LBM66_02985, partial [Bifidobacteriaceae bacterium]|nr:hypothetical protein [Bifidobacteriaceae bacterium]
MTPARHGRRVAAAAVAAAVAGGALVWRRGRPAPPAFSRRNYRGREVDLRGGVGAAAGLLAGIAAGGGREAAGGVVAVAAAAGAGLFDDLRGGAQAKGLKGHLRALAHGQVTTGAVKIAVIGLGALAGAMVGGAGARGGGSRAASVGRVLVDGALTAGTANLVNLLDLRPGRALKTVLAAAGPLVAGGGPGVAVAAAAAGAGAAS